MFQIRYTAPAWAGQSRIQQTVERKTRCACVKCASCWRGTIAIVHVAVVMPIHVDAVGFRRSGTCQHRGPPSMSSFSLWVRITNTMGVCINMQWQCVTIMVLQIFQQVTSQSSARMQSGSLHPSWIELIERVNQHVCDLKVNLFSNAY